MLLTGVDFKTYRFDELFNVKKKSNKKIEEKD